MEELIKKTEGFVGADIENLVRKAALNALRDNIKSDTVTMDDFESALIKSKPSVSEETAKRYKKMEEYFLKTAKAGMPSSGPVYTG